MVDPVPPQVKSIWQKWNIRGTVLFSLSLQIFLILVAPYRKSTRKKLLIMLIWSAYLLADAAANFSVGLISNSQDSSPLQDPKENNSLLAFWAPFLLLHLGGPDTITAFALEDNELWLRHLLALGFQAVAALYVFLQSIPNRLCIPIVFMFFAGTIKYVERTRALYLASLDRFRESMLEAANPGPNYAKLMEEYALKRQNQLMAQIIMIPGPEKDGKATEDPLKEGRLSELEVVHYAYKYFNIIKGLVVDLTSSFHKCNESREFFRVREPEDALRVIEVELNFIYEVFYTKMEVVHCIPGYMFRGVGFGSILASLVFFHFKTKKHEFDQFDVGVTYTLLLGAIALDGIAFLMLVFSDRMFVSIKNPGSGILAIIFKKFLSFKNPWWRSHECETTNVKVVKGLDTKHNVLATPILFRRWSGSLSSYNLLSYCLKCCTSRTHKFTRWPRVIAENITGFLHIKGCYQFVVDLIIAPMEAMKYLVSGVINMFSAIKDKLAGINASVSIKLMQIPSLDHIIRKISSLFGHVHSFIMGRMGVKDFLDEITYVSREPFIQELWEFIFKELKDKADWADDPEKAKKISAARGEWVLKDRPTEKVIDYSSLLQYVTAVTYDESLLLWHIATDLCYYSPEEKPLDKESFDCREFSKLLSDYVLYLLIMQPTMMSAVGGNGKIRFRDTCAEAEIFFERRGLLTRQIKKKTKGERVMKACKDILSVNTDVKPVVVKGDESKSVLFDAAMLAKELKELEKKGMKKWKLLCQLWVELISYAASHCAAITHAQQVSKGGELITVIWLLMAHFGIGEKFEMNEKYARAKLIVGK